MISDWIKFEDEFPPNLLVVLCSDIHNENFISLGRYDDENDEFQMMSIDGLEIDSTATHWRFLPEGPQDD